jgi:hypothetical protein
VEYKGHTICKECAETDDNILDVLLEIDDEEDEEV